MTQPNDAQNKDKGAPAFSSRRGVMGGPGRGGPMGGPMGGMGSGEKPKSFKKAMATFLKYLSPYKVALIFVLIFAIASTVFMILGLKMLGNATTILFNGIVAKATHTGTGVDFTAIGRICLELVGLYVLSFIFSYLQGYIMSGIAMKVTYMFRRNISEKIKRLPL